MKSLSIMLNEAFEFNDSVNSLPYSGAVKKEILTKCSPTDEVTQILVNTVLPKIYDIISGMKFAKELEFNIINSKTFKIFQYSTSQIGMQFDKISQSGFELDIDEMYKKLNAYLSSNTFDVGADIFSRGLCLPSDIKMTEEQQDKVIQIVHKCFQ